jgi:hypothetical protein
MMQQAGRHLTKLTDLEKKRYRERERERERERGLFTEEIGVLEALGGDEKNLQLPAHHDRWLASGSSDRAQ